MWDNTHFVNYFFLHCTEITCNSTKVFHSTITAINHGGRNCHVFNTKQEVLLYKSGHAVNKKYPQNLEALI